MERPLTRLPHSQVTECEPNVMWLSGLHVPESYLTALVQATCRRNGWPLDRSTLFTHVTKFQDAEEVTERAGQGATLPGDPHLPVGRRPVPPGSEGGAAASPVGQAVGSHAAVPTAAPALPTWGHAGHIASHWALCPCGGVPGQSDLSEAGHRAAAPEAPKAGPRSQSRGARRGRHIRWSRPAAQPTLPSPLALVPAQGVSL